MKKLLFALFLFPAFAFAQKNDYKVSGEKITLNFSSTYAVQRDTSATGVVTVVLIPTGQIKTEMESKLTGLKAQRDAITAQRAELLTQQRDLNGQIKEVEALLVKIGN